MKELKWNIKTCWSKHHYHRFYVSLSLIIDILRATEQQPNMLAGNIISLYLVARFYYALLVSSVFFFKPHEIDWDAFILRNVCILKGREKNEWKYKIDRNRRFYAKIPTWHEVKFRQQAPKNTNSLIIFINWWSDNERLLTKNYKFFHYFLKKDNCPAK